MVRGYRARYQRKPAPVPASLQRRIEQYSAARALPAGPERRRALRPIRMRGYVRLGLLAAEVIWFLVRAPLIGAFPALIGSFALVALTFLGLHWLL